MLYKVRYIIYTGYVYIRKISIMRANDAENAIKILRSEIGPKLKGESCILSQSIKAERCNDDNGIFYDGNISI